MSEAIEQTKNNLDLDNPIIRILLAGFISVFTTFAILWVMQILIATGEDSITKKNDLRFVDFVRVKKDESLDTKTAKRRSFFFVMESSPVAIRICITQRIAKVVKTEIKPASKILIIGLSRSRLFFVCSIASDIIYFYLIFFCSN
jgi:hypothetical protein